MYKKLTVLLAAIILLVANTYAEDTQKINLKWNFTQGQTFTLEGAIQLNAQAEIPQQMLLPQVNGQQIPAQDPTAKEQAEGNLNLDLLWGVKVLNIDNAGNADLEMTLKGALVKADGKLGDQQMTYEADLLKPSLASGGTQPAIDPQSTTHVWKVAPDGKVIAINGQDVDKALGELQQQLSNSGVAVNKDQMRQLTDMFLYFMAVYPAEPVTIGQAWTRKVDLSNLLQSGSNHDGVVVNNFQLQLQQDWQVKNADSSSITLEGISKAMPKFEMSLDGPDATVNFSATGNEQSQVTVDKIKGFVNASNQKLDISGNLNAKEKAGSAQEFHIPFTLNVKSNFSLKQ